MPNGIAPIKPEYLIRDRAFDALEEDDDDAEAAATTHTAEGNVAARTSRSAEDADTNDESGPPAKKPKLSGAQKKKLARSGANTKNHQGQNKNRHFTIVTDAVEVCWKFANGETCASGSNCRFSHDLPVYLNNKPKDLYWPSEKPALSDSAPFIPAPCFTESELAPSINTATICPNFSAFGHCNYGLKCRYLGGHVRATNPSENNGIPFEVVKQNSPPTPLENNFIDNSVLKKLRSRKYPTPKSDAYLKEIEMSERSASQKRTSKLDSDTPTTTGDAPEPSTSTTEPATEFDDSPDSVIRPSEKRRLHWEGKMHLAPLATVGNMPFRRICVDLGADVTCSEMAVATSLLQGNKEEWSLVRSHPSEKEFGIQLAGSKPAVLAHVSEVLTNELGGGFQYANVNCGCPIDVVFHTGAGSALLDAPTRLGRILHGMNRALGEIPLTIKVRTGVKDGKNTAHKLIPNLSSWGVGSFAIHGRTRQQRYTKLSDWDYVKSCADALRDLGNDTDTKIPIIGNGDIYSPQGYYEAMDQTGVDAIMIGRGALIKPWIFTEIKERRDWDISATERLELIRRYSEYGLNHWGSDSQGINQTRRFLCEALSFQHRYVPLGILETLPPMINDRPPPFRGRNELESLLASTAAKDWVKISEMFLGPTPDNWTFTPKHKSSSVDSNNG